MAFLPESPVWEPGIYQFEETDVLQGGANGIDNIQAKQLVNRILFIKALVDTLAIGTQPLDATLSALAAIATAADRLIYSTGADTFTTTPFTAFARTLLDDIDAAAARATLGAAALASPAFTGVPTAPTAAVATNSTQLATTAFVQAVVSSQTGSQPLDATLTAIAALATAADRLIYATGVDTFAITPLTAFARALLDDADAVTARATLGAAATTVVNTWTKAQRGDIAALVDGSTITPDFSLANNFSVTLSANRTLAAPSNLVAGQSGIISIAQDAAGSRTLAFASAWKFAGGTVPSLTSTANAVDELAYYVRPGGTTVFAALNKDVK